MNCHKGTRAPREALMPVEVGQFTWRNYDEHMLNSVIALWFPPLLRHKPTSQNKSLIFSQILQLIISGC